MTGIVADPLCCEHDPGVDHPEALGRFAAVLSALEESGLLGTLRRLPARDATFEELRLCHTSAYLSRVEYEIHEGASQLSTGDTAIGDGSWAAALRATGSVLSAVDAVFAGQVQNAFCVIRPPGHHATADRGMGFCIFNHVAIAARYAQRRWEAGRILIIDWDVHHGNGTQDIFYDDPTVFYFSTHQAPLYPGTGDVSETGVGAGLGSTLNCPLPAGSGRAEIFHAFTSRLAPAMETFRPDLVLISAGFDSRVNDPLGDFRLTDTDFADLTTLVADLAQRYAGGRLVSLLEGGYNLSGLGAAAAAHVGALKLAAERE